ncbi:hypothetical protein DID96_19215 [Burkholderia sp. Bp8963]|uniref:hypothetical protein n=1 Tax=Burkholderia sp. Bp8963 TaxID=2184547 RepID=UPI000F5B60F1|nr:hypothetical protein [Burkholderia sp. Bp8963]RQS68715.1 hypothetical protein DID96_19215 [Burkholderia sp. Bp8963]
MTSRSVPAKARRFFVLDADDVPVEVFDESAWTRWMAENDLVFRRTVLDESGVTITTRFRGVADAKTVDVCLFVTRIAGMAVQDNKAFAARTADEALEQHERLLQEILRKLTGR